MLESEVKAAVDAVDAGWVTMRQFGSDENTKLMNVQKDARFSAAGQEEERQSLRRATEDKARPTLQAVLERVAKIEAMPERTLEGLLTEHEFCIDNETDGLRRAHLAAVLPRMSNLELDRVISHTARTIGTAEPGWWRLAMLRREAIYRLSNGSSEDEKKTLGSLLERMQALEPADFREHRAALIHLRQTKDRIERAFRELGKWGWSGGL